jgi:glutamine synthetase
VNLDELQKRVDSGEIDTVLLALTDMQGRLQGKRFTARHFVEEVAAHGAEGCNYLLAVDVEMNTVDGYAMSSWERGYGDFAMRPDLSTLRPVPWQGPCPTTRSEQVRLSGAHATAVGANEPSA